MADKTLTIEIKIKDETTSGETNTSNSDKLEHTSSKTTNGEQDALGSSKLMKDPVVQKGIAAGQMTMSALNFTVNTLINEASFQIDYMFATNDDYIGQRNLQVASQYISAAQSYGNSILQGATSGAAFGLPGIILGGAIGAATTGIRIAQQNAHAQQMEDLTLRQMETSLEFTRSRAGREYSTRAASIGEDL